MKIVYVTNKPIFPLLDGGCVAMNQFLKCLLAAGYDVKNFTISTQKHPFKQDEYPNQIREIIRTKAFFINTKVTLSKAILYLFKKGSYNINRFNDSLFAVELEKYIVDNKIDLVILESVFLSGYIEGIRSKSRAKIIIRSHNVESQIWNRLARNQENVLKRWYFSKLAKDLKTEELKSLNAVDGIACISSEDKELFKVFGVTTPMCTAPVAIEINETECDYSVDSFYHLGSMNWEPNIEAVRHLIDVIFPEIRLKIPNAKLYLAGSFMPKEFVSDTSKGIEVLGFVENANDFKAKHGIMLAPIKSGSGVRIKILKGMGMGVPIVTTVVGAEGIPAKNDSELYIAKNDTEFIDYAVSLAQSQEKRTSLGANAKTFIESNYQIETVTKNLIEFIKHIS